MDNEHEQIEPRPLSGAAVDPLQSGLVPARTRIEGRHVRLNPLVPALHVDGLFTASHTSEERREI